MNLVVRRLSCFVILLLAACSGHHAPDGGPSGTRDRSLLTHEQLNAIAYQSAYHAVEALRSHWLRPRGVSSPNPASSDEVIVLLNNTRLGGVDSLRGLSTQEITYIRYYDAASAAARWGRDLSQGAIFVSTERR
jgi:hypothetical protein